MKNEDAQNRMNSLGQNGVPFLFVLNYNLSECHVYPLGEINPSDILFNLQGKTNESEILEIPHKIDFSKTPLTFSDYQKKFDIVFRNIQHGNSYLTNLTQPTPVSTNLTLQQLYHVAGAKYKLYFRNQFAVFSPEPFVKISQGKIFSYPMKGTIDADIDNAADILKNDFKEKAEHNTIVDLIRNDLSMSRGIFAGLRPGDNTDVLISDIPEFFRTWQNDAGRLKFSCEHIEQIAWFSGSVTVNMIKDILAAFRNHFIHVYAGCPEGGFPCYSFIQGCPDQGDHFIFHPAPERAVFRQSLCRFPQQLIAFQGKGRCHVTPVAGSQNRL